MFGRASAQVESDEYNSAKAGAVKTVNHDGTYLGVDAKDRNIYLGGQINYENIS